MRNVKLGVQINRYDPVGPGATIASTFADRAIWADRAGVSTLFAMDHFFQIASNGDAHDPMLEVYSALSYAAALTSRIDLGQMVLGVTYRDPGVLVKTATTLDVLSGGRTYFGIGAAWFEREHLGLGVAFPSLTERFERLEETLQIAKQMWAGNESPFAGKHYQLAEPICQPQPVSKPHPKILVGGSGERKTLRLVAQYGDACNIILREPGMDYLRHKLDVLKAHCEAVGRDYSEIEITTMGGFRPLSRTGAEGTMSPQEAIEFCGELATEGVDQVILGIALVDAPESRDVVARDIIPSIASIQTAGRSIVPQPL
jgi:F420-dependent oxidoreductase-like protein